MGHHRPDETSSGGDKAGTQSQLLARPTIIKPQMEPKSRQLRQAEAGSCPEHPHSTCQAHAPKHSRKETPRASTTCMLPPQQHRQQLSGPSTPEALRSAQWSTDAACCCHLPAASDWQAGSHRRLSAPTLQCGSCRNGTNSCSCPCSLSRQCTAACRRPPPPAPGTGPQSPPGT